MSLGVEEHIGEDGLDPGVAKRSRETLEEVLGMLQPDWDPTTGLLARLGYGLTLMLSAFSEADQADRLRQLERSADMFDQVVMTMLDQGLEFAVPGIEFLSAEACYKRAQFAQGTQRLDWLARAEQRFSNAVEGLNPSAQFKEWLRGKRTLATILPDLAEASPPDRAGRMFRAVVHHLDDVLKAIEREKDPLYWAIAQRDLGYALVAVTREPPPQGEPPLPNSLEGALTCTRRALEVLTREAHPLHWGGAQNQLGLALGEQALRLRNGGGYDPLDARQRLQEAMEAFDAAGRLFVQFNDSRNLDVVNRNRRKIQDAWESR
jgi:hypothetical protein